MTTSNRVITSQKMDEATPANIFPDLDWAMDNREQLRSQFLGDEPGQKLLLIFKQQVVGQGRSIHEAIADAEAHLAPDADPITPIIFTVGGFNPLLRIPPDLHSALKARN